MARGWFKRLMLGPETIPEPDSPAHEDPHDNHSDRMNRLKRRRDAYRQTHERAKAANEVEG